MDKNFYITTPIYYPSAKPHMGHAYSSIIADVFARFKRNDNCKVHFLTGTDEHGLKIQKAAEKSGLDPKKYCDKISKGFKIFPLDLDIFSSPDKIQPWPKTLFGGSISAESKKAGQYIAWNLKISFPIICKVAGQKFLNKSSLSLG